MCCKKQYQYKFIRINCSVLLIYVLIFIKRMPMYEGLGGLPSDYKLPSVLDIGSAYTKLGISGEYAPRAIIRSEVHCKKRNVRRKLTSYTDKDDLYDLLVEFIHTIYFKYLLANPKDKPVIVVESLLAPTVWRETIASVLYRHYEVGSLLLVPSHLVALAPLALDTGLVLDVGATEATVIPVYSGVSAAYAWQALPLGTNAVHDNLKLLLERDNVGAGVSALPNSIIEDISVRCCFVTTRSRSEQFQQPKSQRTPSEDVAYPVGGARAPITVSGRVRELAHEIQHDEDGDQLCLATMLLDACARVTVDMRLALLGNIVVIGGGAMANGFKARLLEELRHRIKSGKCTKYGQMAQMDSAHFKIHTMMPGRENYSAWLGGAIYGCTEVVGMRAMTRDQYFKENRLPDWIDIRDNSAEF